MSSSPPPRALRAATALLFGVILATYAALGWAGFVWDDTPLVMHNGLTDDLTRLPEFFEVDLWETSRTAHTRSGYYRPLMLLSLAIDRALWGLSPAGHHLHSVLWHCAAVGALSLLLRRLLPPGAALFGAAIFGLHPAQSEAVAWIAARNDLMVAAFTFLAVALLAEERPGRWRLFAGGVAALAAALSKESGVACLPLLALLDLARWGRPRGWPRYAVLGVALLIWIALRVNAGISATSTPDAAALAFLLERSPQLVAWYAHKLAWPAPLTIGASLEYLDLSAAQLALAPIGLTAVAVALWRGGRGLALAGLGFAALAFAPSLIAIALRGQLGERYLYMPMGGLALAFAAAIPETASARRATWLAFAPLVVIWTAMQHGRLPEWRSDLTLRAAAVRDAPSPYTWVSLAHVLTSEGQLGPATQLFHRALDHRRPDHDACFNAVKVPISMGDFDAARRGVELTVAARCPRQPELLGMWAVVEAQEQDWELARQHIDEALALKDALLPRVAIAGGAVARVLDDGALYAAMYASYDVGPEAFSGMVDAFIEAAEARARE